MLVTAVLQCEQLETGSFKKAPRNDKGSITAKIKWWESENFVRISLVEIDN